MRPPTGNSTPNQQLLNITPLLLTPHSSLVGLLTTTTTKTTTITTTTATTTTTTNTTATTSLIAGRVNNCSWGLPVPMCLSERGMKRVHSSLGSIVIQELVMLVFLFRRCHRRRCRLRPSRHRHPVGRPGARSLPYTHSRTYCVHQQCLEPSWTRSDLFFVSTCRLNEMSLGWYARHCLSAFIAGAF